MTAITSLRYVQSLNQTICRTRNSIVLARLALSPLHQLRCHWQHYFALISLCLQVRRPLALYLMMGRGLVPISTAFAGNVIGIGGLGAHILKTATLCTTPACLSLSPMTFQVSMHARLHKQTRAHVRANSLACTWVVLLLKLSHPLCLLCVWSCALLPLACAHWGNPLLALPCVSVPVAPLLALPCVCVSVPVAP